MSTSISIPHQHVQSDAGVNGTVRGTLVTNPDGDAHGHLAIGVRDSSRRYRALTGSINQNGVHSIQLERIQTDAGMVELASLEITLLGDNRSPGAGKDAKIVIRRIPDDRELFRATVLLNIEPE